MFWPIWFLYADQVKVNLNNPTNTATDVSAFCRTSFWNQMKALTSRNFHNSRRRILFPVRWVSYPQNWYNSRNIFMKKKVIRWISRNKSMVIFFTHLFLFFLFLFALHVKLIFNLNTICMSRVRKRWYISSNLYFIYKINSYFFTSHFIYIYKANVKVCPFVLRKNVNIYVCYLIIQ